MDDSIWRDYYAAVDWVQTWWAYVQPILKSDQAMRIYTIAAAFIVIAISLFIAYRAKERLRELKYAAFDRRFPGQTPSQSRAIQKRINAIKDRRRSVWIGFAKDFGIIIGFGLFIPAIALFAFCSNYFWFDISGIAFVGLLDSLPKENITHFDLAKFVANQILQAALLDFPEVFKISVGILGNNDNNYWFSSVVLLFRTIVGIFSITLAIASWDAFRALWKLKRNPPDKLFIAQTNIAH